MAQCRSAVLLSVFIIRGFATSVQSLPQQVVGARPALIKAHDPHHADKDSWANFQSSSWTRSPSVGPGGQPGLLRGLQFPATAKSSTQKTMKTNQKLSEIGTVQNLKTWIAHNGSSRVWKVACDQHIKLHPDEIECPSNCPFVRSEPTRLCQFKCVPASSCNSDNPLASYANPNSMRCETCKVAGCHRCGKTRTVCAECHEDFSMVDGLCKSRYRHHWHACFVCVGIVAVIAVYYLFALFFLRDSHANEEALKAGLKFRERSKAHQKTTKRDQNHMVQLNVFKNLMKDDTTFGLGVMLQFRWMGAIFVWAGFGMIVFVFAAIMFAEQLSAVNFHTPNSRKSYEACEENVSLQEKKYNSVEVVYFVCLLIFYLGTFLGSLWLAAKFYRTYEEKDKKAITMKDYALLLSGFPVYGGRAKVEDELKAFLEGSSHFQGLEIVGVSVCWDIKDMKVQDAIGSHMKHEFDVLGGLADAQYKRQTGEAQQNALANSRHCGFDYEMKCVDGLLGVDSGESREAQQTQESYVEGVETFLNNLQTSGSIFVVMGSMNEQKAACEKLQDKLNPLYFENNGCKWPIVVEESESEPVTVLWNGFGESRSRFVLSLVLGSIVVFIGVLILDIFFYAPYVVYILSVSDVAGMTQGGAVSGFLLGLLITVCNQIIYIIIGAVADRCAWTSTDSRDCFYCVKYTIAVFFNTCIDLGTVLILAQGYSVDQAMKMQVAADSTLSSKAVAESPDLQMALYVQLTLYIFPACMLTPFLIEPIGTALAPYFLNKALVRSRQDVTVQDAEQLLQHPPYDLSRYGDIIVNMMLCCLTMAFTYHDLWLMYLYMIISLAVIYAWDQLRVLRFTTKTVFATGTMSTAVMYMMAMPCGVLLACLVFKAYGASHQGFLDELRRLKEEARNVDGGIDLTPNRYNIFMYVAGAFLLHVIIHWISLHYVIKHIDRNMEREEEPNEVYKVTAKQRPANYFNTNPIHCLRSKYVYNEDIPCIFFRQGKEHLLKKNTKAENKKRPLQDLHFEVEEGEEETYQEGHEDHYVGQAKRGVMAFVDGEGDTYFGSDEIPDTAVA